MLASDIFTANIAVGNIRFKYHSIEMEITNKTMNEVLSSIMFTIRPDPNVAKMKIIAKQTQYHEYLIIIVYHTIS